MIPAVMTPEIVMDLEQEKRNEAIYRARLRALGDLTQPLHDQVDALLLRPYQVEGVEFLLKNQFAILSDDMGLGKTVQSLVAARAYHLGGYFIYVVAPVTLHETWRNEAKKVGVPLAVFSWANVPKPLTLTPYILIADEAHYAQNGAMEQGYWHIPQPDGSVKQYVGVCSAALSRIRHVPRIAQKFSSFMLHSDSRSQEQINVCEKKAGAHMQSSNHAPQYERHTNARKETMMKNERKPYEYAWYYTRYKGLYDRILTVLKEWDIWHIKAFDGVMSLYEGEVVQLLKHLPSTHNADEVYRLLTAIFAAEVPFFDYATHTEDLYRMSQEIWFLWTQYLQVQDAQPSARARALLLHDEQPMIDRSRR